MTEDNKEQEQCTIQIVIERLTSRENRMQHGCNSNGSFMCYDKDGHYISINQIYRVLAEMDIKLK